MKLLAYSALRNGPTKAWGDTSALRGAAGPRRVYAVVLLEGAVQSSNFAGRQVRCCMLGMMMVS